MVKSKKTDKRDEIIPEDPGCWLELGLILSVVFFVITGFILPIILPESVGTALNQFTSVLTVLIGLFGGALVYKKIYDYVNHQKQIRDWQHDYSLSQMKEIYAPLFDETSDLIGQLQLYGGISPRFEERQFSLMKKRHYNIFMDSQTYDLLETFHKTLSDYEEVQRQTWNDFFHSAERICIEITGLDPQTSNIRNLKDSIVQDHAFFYGSPGFQRYREVIKEAFSRTYREIPGLKQEYAANDFETILYRIQSLESINKLKVSSLECQKKGESALERLTEIIKDPSRVKLAFLDQGSH